MTFGAIAQAPGDVRVALVIGNGAYTSAPALPNPSNDAQAMGNALRKIGFTVIELRDGSKAQMAEGILKVRDALNGKQGVGMLYYAGHGLQMDARNYMVPVNAKMSKAADIPGQTVDVGSVIDAFKAAGNRMNILVLDACRDNPFGGITSGKGLAPLDAPSGTFLAYATAPGNVAEDGDIKTGNGLYTQFLLQELAKPQARIEDVFKRVRFAVRKASNGRQIPWESTSLEDDFQFNDGRVVKSVKADEQRLLAEFMKEKPVWDRIKASNNPDDFYEFLQKYPSGTLTEAAQGRLNILTKPAMVVQGVGPGGKDQAYMTARFKIGDEYDMRSAPGSPTSGMTERNKVEKVSTTEVTVNVLIDFAPGQPPLKMTTFWTPDGASLGNNYNRYDPPQYDVPGGLLQVGLQWPVAYATSTGTKVTGDGKVLAREKITTPAGTFDTFKILQTIKTVSASGEKNEIISTVWLAPEIPTYVRVESKMDGALINISELNRFVRQ